MNANRIIRSGALLISAVAGLLGSATAEAQAPFGVASVPGPPPIRTVRQDRLPRTFPAPAYRGTWGGGYWGGGNFVGTAQSTALHGQADVLRSLGQHNLLTAEARRSLEAARSHAIDNSLKVLETRLERQRLGRARVLEEQQQRRAARERYRNARDNSTPEPPDLELAATSRLTNALSLLDRGKHDDARKWLARLLEEFPETEAAAEAADLLVALR